MAASLPMNSLHIYPAPAAPSDNPPASGIWGCFRRGSELLQRLFSSDGQQITSRRLALVTVALMVGAFFLELDKQLLVIAIPRITTEFQSLHQAAWYQASYDLARLSCLLIYGRVYTLFPLKIVYCSNIVVYIAGSVVCATATHSAALIVGRAIQGCAHAALSLGGFIIICHAVSARMMPSFLAIIVLMTSVAAAAGPPLGGIFAETSMTWRLSFFLGTALALLSGLLIALSFPEPVRLATRASFRARLNTIDHLSCPLILASLTALFMALQWGWSMNEWVDPKVLGALAVFVVLGGLFMFIQVKEKDRALIPIRILAHRTVGFACLFSAFIVMAVVVPAYYMHFYFQAAKGLSPPHSGVYTLALTVPDAIMALAVGATVTLLGHYVPFMVTSGAVVAIASGLLSSIKTDTGVVRVLGFELLAAFGLGLGVQLPFSAVRNALEEPDIPAAQALILFAMSLGSTLALPLAQTVFMNTLSHRLAARLPAINVAEILQLGPSKVNAHHMEQDLVPFVAESYAKAVTNTFYLSIAASGLAMIAAAWMEWRKIPARKIKVPTGGVLTGIPLSDAGASNETLPTARPVPGFEYPLVKVTGSSSSGPSHESLARTV